MRTYSRSAALLGPFVYSVYVLFLAVLVATVVSLFNPRNVQRVALAISESYTETLGVLAQPETPSTQGSGAKEFNPPSK